jgi:hypothetical protein
VLGGPPGAITGSGPVASADVTDGPDDDLDDVDLDHDGEDDGRGDDGPDDGHGDVQDEARWPGPTTAYAVNWKIVLAVDAAMGAVVALAGLVSMVVWSFPLGVFLTGLGLFYVAMVARRARGWQHLRREAGL